MGQELLKISFSTLIRPIVSEEKDKYLALASLDNLRAFLPKIDLEKNIDLLPIACNACVVNRVNKNDDGITTAMALDISDYFVNKPIDIEHDRTKIVGVILTAGFSEFGTDKPLTREEVKDLKKPFNLTLGGIVWRIVSSSLADIIEESNDPTSPYYLKVSASWELGFYDYEIAELTGDDKNLENATFVKPDDKLSESLRCYGGTGVSPDGKKRLYRVPVGEVKPLGIGLTDSPAAEVEGVAVPAIFSKPQATASNNGSETMSVTIISTSNQGANQAITTVSNPIVITPTQNIISQPNEINVKKNSLTMKITDLKDITDESLKTITASDINEFISNKIKEASEQYVKEKNATQESLDKAKKDNETLLAEHNKTKSEVEELKKQVNQINEQTKARENQEKFNNRMSVLNEKYELDDDLSKLIASEIKDMSDEKFEAYQKNLNVLLKGKEKKAPEAAASTTTTAAVAPVVTSTASTPAAGDSVVSDAIDKGTPLTPNVPATSTTKQPTMKEQYAAAFEESQWVLNPSRKNKK